MTEKLGQEDEVSAETLNIMRVAYTEGTVPGPGYGDIRPHYANFLLSLIEDDDYEEFVSGELEVLDESDTGRLAPLAHKVLVAAAQES